MKATVYIALISAMVWLSVPVHADTAGETGLPAVAPPVQTLDAAIENYGKPAAPAPVEAPAQAPINEPAPAPNQVETKSQAVTPIDPSAHHFGAPIVYVYEFGASWCPSCRKLAPIVEEATNKFTGFAEYIPVNVDKNQDLVQKLNVAQIPTVMVVDRRGRMLNRLVGLQQGKQIDAILEHYKAQTIATLNRKSTQ